MCTSAQKGIWPMSSASSLTPRTHLLMLTVLGPPRARRSLCPIGTNDPGAAASPVASLPLFAPCRVGLWAACGEPRARPYRRS